MCPIMALPVVDLAEMEGGQIQASLQSFSIHIFARLALYSHVRLALQLAKYPLALLQLAFYLARQKISSTSNLRQVSS